MIAVLAAMAAAALVGLVAHRGSPEAAEGAAALALRFVFWIVMPFLIVCTLPSLHVDGAVAVSLVLAYVALAISGLIAWTIGTKVLRLARAGVGTLICCAVIANTGYFGLPFVRALLGTDDLPSAIAFDSLVSGPMFYVVGLTIGAWFGGRHGARPPIARILLRNPPLFATVVGLLLPSSAIPSGLVDASHDAIWPLIALGFFALGVTLASEASKRPLAFPPRLDAEVGTALALRCVVAPAVFIGLTALAGGAPPAFRLESAMPVGIHSLVVAHATDLDLRVTASAIAWSTTVVAAWGLIAAAL